LHFVQEKITRFDLALECGNLDIALDMANTLNKPDVWNRLAEQALKQGNYQVRLTECVDRQHSGVLV
jgi:coatomer subunit alpha